MAVKVTGVDPGVYKDPDTFQRYQVLNTGEVIALRGVLTSSGFSATGTPDPSKYADIANAPAPLATAVQGLPVLRTVEDVKSTTTLPSDTEGLPQPGGGKQVEALRERKPGQAEAFDQERAAALSAIAPYKSGEGYDVARAVREGVPRETLISAGVRAADIDRAEGQAAEFKRQEQARNELAEAEQARRRAEATARQTTLERVAAAGGLIQALQSDVDGERITRAQAIAAGYTEGQIDGALADEQRYIAERAKYENDVRAQAEQQRALAALESYRTPTGYDLTAAVTAGVDETALRQAGFKPEQVAAAFAARQAAQAASEQAEAFARERAAFESRLAAYASEKPGEYRIATALAAGDVDESDVRRFIAPDAVDATLADAERLRRMADAGYYADGSLVPESLRRVLLVRSSEMSKEIGEQQRLGRAATGARIDALRRDIATIDKFLANGGLSPDIGVSMVARDVQEQEGFLARLQAQRESASPGQRSGLDRQIASTESTLARRRADLAEAVRRAETDPLTTLRTDPPASALVRLAERAPSEVVGAGLREAALFVGTGAIATVALRGAIRVGAAAGRGVAAARAALPSAREVVQSLDDALRLTAENRALGKFLERHPAPAGGSGEVTYAPEIVRFVEDLNIAVAREARQANITRFQQVLADIRRSGAPKHPDTLTAEERARLAKQLEQGWGELDRLGVPLDAEGVPLTDDLMALVRADLQVREEAAQRAIAALSAMGAGSITAVERQALTADLNAVEASLSAARQAAEGETASSSATPTPIAEPVQPTPVMQPNTPQSPAPADTAGVPEAGPQPERVSQEVSLDVPLTPEPSLDVPPEGQTQGQGDGEAQGQSEGQGEQQTEGEAGVISVPVTGDVSTDIDQGTSTETDTGIDTGAGTSVDESTGTTPDVSQETGPTPGLGIESGPGPDPVRDLQGAPRVLPGVVPTPKPSTRVEPAPIGGLGTVPVTGGDVGLEIGPDTETAADTGIQDDTALDDPLTKPATPRTPRTTRTPAPRPRRGTPQRKPAQGNTQKRPLGPEWVGRKQGFGYKYNNLVTGEEMFSRQPLFGGAVPDLKGKGAAYNSYTVLSRTERPANRRLDQMGMMNVRLNGAPKFKRRARKARRPRR